MQQINANRRGYKHTPLGWIPKEWTVKVLADDIATLDSGVSVNSHDTPATNGSYGILKTSCVSEGSFRPEYNKLIVEEEIQRAKLSPVANSIIISRMNTPERVGESGYVEQDMPNLFLPDRLWQTVMNANSSLNVKWLSYLLASSKYRAKVRNAATGTSNSMKNISKDTFLSIPFICPTTREQDAISGILSLWDDGIKATHQLTMQLRQRNIGLMQQLLTGKKRLRDLVEGG